MSPMPADAGRVAKLAGAELYYERGRTTDPWGDLAPEEQFSPYMLPSFRARCERWVVDVQRHSGRPLKAVISAGAYVDKPGAHGMARAKDVDGLVWEDGPTFDARTWSTPHDQQLYAAVQATCMVHFGNVLAFDYNRAHEDHLHCDDLLEPGFRANSRAVVTGVQRILVAVWGRDLGAWGPRKDGVDGDWGPTTQQAMASVETFPGRYPTADSYLRFLERSAREGFRLAGVLPPPSTPTPVPSRLTLEQRVALLEKRVGSLEGGT